ncbi:MAG: hypothetical protein J3K34DRAFT_475024, partial [Monoraphidium minutum]
VDDAAYVVRSYPFAAGAALAQLGAAGWLAPRGPGALRGVWWGLATYYAALLAAFGGRCWWRAARAQEGRK